MILHMKISLFVIALLHNVFCSYGGANNPDDVISDSFWGLKVSVLVLT